MQVHRDSQGWVVHASIWAKGCALEPVPAGPAEGEHVVPGLAVDLQIGRRLTFVRLQDVEDLPNVLQARLLADQRDLGGH